MNIFDSYANTAHYKDRVSLTGVFFNLTRYLGISFRDAMSIWTDGLARRGMDNDLDFVRKTLEQYESEMKEERKHG